MRERKEETMVRQVVRLLKRAVWTLVMVASRGSKVACTYVGVRREKMEVMRRSEE